MHIYSTSDFSKRKANRKMAVPVLRETSISFKGKDFCLKNISELPCPCCGRIMKKFTEVQDVKNTIIQLKGIDLIRYIGKVKIWLPPKEEHLLTMLQRESLKNGADNFFDLLIKLKENILYKSKESAYIMKLAHRALNNKDKMSVLDCIFDSCRMTEEHIVPKSLGGQDNCSNIILECKACNTQKGNKNLSYQIKKHPSMFYTLQHYFDVIFKKINRKEIADDYIEELLERQYFANIQKLLFEESNGKFKIDISKLNTNS